MGASKRIISNTIYLYAKMFYTTIISLYTARIFLNVLGASDFGIYHLVLGAIALFGFIQASLVMASLRYMCYYIGKGEPILVNSVFNISVLLHILMSIIVCCLLLSITDFLFNGFLNIPEERIDVARFIFLIMIGTVFFNIMCIPYDSVLNANENMLVFSIIGIIEATLKLILALTISSITIDKLIYYSIGFSIISIFSFLLRVFYCHYKYKECHFSFRLIQASLLLKMLRYASWNLLTSISFMFTVNATSVILNRFFGTVVNAAQGIANQVNASLLQFSSNLLKSINPLLSKSLGEKNEEKMMRLSFTGSKLSFIIFAVFCMPFIVEAPYILKLWLNNVPEWCVIFCQLLLLRTVIQQLTTLFINSIYANDNIRNYCIVKSIFNCLSVIGVYVFFKLGEPPYYAYISLFIFMEIFGGITIVYYCRKMYSLSIIRYLRELVMPSVLILAVELGLGNFVCLIMEESIERLLLNILLTASILIVVTWNFLLKQDERSVFFLLRDSVLIRFGYKLHD